VGSIQKRRDVRPRSESEFCGGALVAEREGLFALRAHPSGRPAGVIPASSLLQLMIRAHENLCRSWRRGRDSNPRRAFDPYALSRGAPSTTRPPLRIKTMRPVAERGMIPARSSPGKAKGI
jgi:hypothetical protein